MMAMFMVASATAFAGDSDALKAILKAKTYADAETLINSSLSSLAIRRRQRLTTNWLTLLMRSIRRKTTSRPPIRCCRRTRQ